jgi:hypothetical protein
MLEHNAGLILIEVQFLHSAIAITIISIALKQKVAIEWIVLPPHIHVVCGSDLGAETGYPG